jgi:uncharacterized protein (DUF488 family)
MDRPLVYTLGTGLRSEEDFIEIMSAYGLKTVIDVRSYPKSKLVHFNRHELSGLLQENGIAYHFLGKELGGLRKGGYTAYIITDSFAEGIDMLVKIAGSGTAVIICSEHLPWKCHRKWIAMELQKRGWEVRHIIDKGRVWTPK